RVASNNLFQTPGVADIPNLSEQLNVGAAGAQFQIDLKQLTFGLIKGDQPARPVMRDLPAKLRADRTGGTGNHHRPPDDVLADTVFLQSHRLATQQVAGGNVTNLSAEHLAVKQLTKTRNGFTNYTGYTAI